MEKKGLEGNFVIHGPEPEQPVSDATLGEEILRSLLIHGADGDRDVMIDTFTHKKLSRRSLLEASCRLAEALRVYGYTPQTVVSISSENSLEFFIPVLASLFIGCILAPINQNYTSRELIHTLDICKPKIIFCSKVVSSNFIRLLQERRHLRQVVIIDSTEEVSGAQTLKEFVEKALKGRHVLPEKFRPFIGDSSTLGAFILCSSGTTGLPKGVLLSHRNAMARVVISSDSRYRFPKTRNANYWIGLMPFFHGYGLNMALYGILNNESVLVMKKFDEDIFLKCIQDYKIPTLTLIPPLAVFLAKSSKIQNYDLSSVEAIVCGAAPLGKETENELRRRLKNVKYVQQAYGLTEATLAVILFERGDVRPGSSGKVAPLMSCIVRHPETGECLGPRKVGELCFKGSQIMLGYYNDEKATKESFTPDGWLRTGDLAYYDEEKYFYIVDRLKELIKYKAFQVTPAELEAIILNHPQVRDVGVVGLPDELAGELPLAFVVKREGATVTEREIQDYVAAQVSPQKRLRGGVIFVPEIPKNPSGKILRRVLKQKLNNYKGQQESKL